jgi:hypothetical protein
MTDPRPDEEVIVEDVQEDLGEIDLDGDGIPDDLEAGDLDELVAAVQDYNVGAITGGDDGTE